MLVSKKHRKEIYEDISRKCEDAANLSMSDLIDIYRSTRRNQWNDKLGAEPQGWYNIPEDGKFRKTIKPTDYKTRSEYCRLIINYMLKNIAMHVIVPHFFNDESSFRGLVPEEEDNNRKGIV